MKKLFAIAFLLWACTAVAHPINDEMFERLFEAKLKMMQDELDLTKHQVNEFAPIYKEYNKEIQKVREQAWEKRKNAPKDTPKDAAKLMRLRADSRIDMLKIQKKYYSQFEKVLTAKQILKFDHAETKIQKKITEHFKKFQKKGRKQ